MLEGGTKLGVLETNRRPVWLEQRKAGRRVGDEVREEGRGQVMQGHARRIKPLDFIQPQEAFKGCQ